jgi:arylsulfatase A
MVCTIDLPSSLAALAGQPVADQDCVDSHNVIDALLGKPGATGRDHLVQQDNGASGSFGLRVGDWKLQRYGKKRARNVVVEAKLANTAVDEFQLFNLENDPGEKENVLKENPKVAARLKAKLDKIIDDGRSR